MLIPAAAFLMIFSTWVEYPRAIERRANVAKTSLIVEVAILIEVNWSKYSVGGLDSLYIASLFFPSMVQQRIVVYMGSNHVAFSTLLLG